MKRSGQWPIELVTCASFARVSIYTSVAVYIISCRAITESYAKRQKWSSKYMKLWNWNWLKWQIYVCISVNNVTFTFNGYPVSCIDYNLILHIDVSLPFFKFIFINSFAHNLQESRYVCQSSIVSGDMAVSNELIYISWIKSKQILLVKV